MDENKDMIESKLIDQIKLDETLAFWRKNYRENEGVYREGVPMPPPLYDEDLKTWTDANSLECDVRKVDRDKLDKFYNAQLVLEGIKLEEEAHKRYEESRKRYEEWRNSDDYKNWMKEIND